MITEMINSKKNYDMKKNAELAVLHNEIKTEVFKFNEKCKKDERLYDMIQTYNWCYRENYEIEALSPENIWNTASGRSPFNEIHFNFGPKSALLDGYITMSEARPDENSIMLISDKPVMILEMSRHENFYGIVIKNIKNINDFSGGEIEFHPEIYIKENNEKHFVTAWDIDSPAYLKPYLSFLKDLNEDLPKFIDRFEAAVKRIEEKENSDDREI